MLKERWVMVKERQVHNDNLLVSVVIPALNETKNLQYVLPYIPPIVSEVILVDGNPLTMRLKEHSNCFRLFGLSSKKEKAKGML